MNKPAWKQNKQQQPAPLVAGGWFAAFAADLAGSGLERSRPLKPLQEESTPLNVTINGQPLLVDFDALNDNPAEYSNKRIQVSGNYLRLEPVDCELFNGPRIQWGLVAEGLQLNARGFEAIVLPIIAPNTQMTLQGIWRRYPGPAGCGKEPPSGLWYLEVEQIVQPNPLMAGTSTPVSVLSIHAPAVPWHSHANNGWGTTGYWHTHPQRHYCEHGGGEYPQQHADV